MATETVAADRPFLDVERSVCDRRWIDRLDRRSRNTALAIAQQTGIPELVGRILAGRSVDIAAAARFLDPTVRDLMPDPCVMTGMEEAAARIAAAIEAGERIAVFGDYDVDGAASAALMARFLRHYGIEPEIYIPDRIFEGYGPNPAAIAELADRGASLIVAVDCGSTSFEALEAAHARGIDVVVLDHHQVEERLPPAVAVVNPNRHDDLSDLGYLCAAGIVFMTLVAVARLLRRRGRSGPELLQLLDLVALATVCDVVPLRGLNRAFVVKGLAAMRHQANPGLTELSRLARLSGPPEGYHLGYILGPRINAGGRIGEAGLGAALLSTDDPACAGEIAAKLDALNTRRQHDEARMLEEAFAEAEAEIGNGPGPPVLVVESDRWHPGLVGLIASRLKDRFDRPAFAIHFDGRGIGSGSGRSVGDVDIGAAVRGALAQGLLLRGGGHRMAAGITLERARLGELRAWLESSLRDAVSRQWSRRDLEIDGALTAGSATLDLYDMIEKAGPYGAGHPAPLFAFPAHAVRRPRVVREAHVSAVLIAGDGRSLPAIAFRAAETPLGRLLLDAPGRIHVVGTLAADFWRGQRRMQLRIVDAAEPLDFIASGRRGGRQPG